METTTLIRVIAGVAAVIVLGIIIFRRKNKAA
jgi:LPXTG-motif cell wall-anchored protein